MTILMTVQRWVLQVFLPSFSMAALELQASCVCVRACVHMCAHVWVCMCEYVYSYVYMRVCCMYVYRCIKQRGRERWFVSHHSVYHNNKLLFHYSWS